MNNIKADLINQTKFKNGMSKTEFKFTSKKGKVITREEVQNIIQAIEARAAKDNEDIKLLIRGLNAQRWTTIKGYNEDVVDDMDEYYDARKVKDASKFNEYFQLQVTIYKSPQ